MSIRRVLIRPVARADTAEARDWYEGSSPGTGRRFVLAVDAAVALALAHPEAGYLIAPGVRRIVVRGFPYAVFYRLREDAIVVVAVFAGARNPAALRSRLRSIH